jgi:hypothetical protein
MITSTIDRIFGEKKELLPKDGKTPKSLSDWRWFRLHETYMQDTADPSFSYFFRVLGVENMLFLFKKVETPEEYKKLLISTVLKDTSTLDTVFEYTKNDLQEFTQAPCENKMAVLRWDFILLLIKYGYLDKEMTDLFDSIPELSLWEFMIITYDEDKGDNFRELVESQTGYEFSSSSSSDDDDEKDEFLYERVSSKDPSLEFYTKEELLKIGEDFVKESDIKDKDTEEKIEKISNKYSDEGVLTESEIMEFKAEILASFTK